MKDNLFISLKDSSFLNPPLGLSNHETFVSCFIGTFNNINKYFERKKKYMRQRAGSWTGFISLHMLGHGTSSMRS